MKAFHFVFTSDTHGHLYPSDYAHHMHDTHCLAHVVPEIQKDGDTLLLDGGDSLQGTPMVQYALAHVEMFPQHPVAAAFNAMGLDYFTLGNHDFNFGYDALRSYLQAMHAQCLCANVEDLGGELPLKKTAIHRLHNGLRIGLAGVVTDWVNVWEKPENLEKLRVGDAFTAAKEVLEMLRGQCDLTVLIYHGGFEEDLESGERLSNSGENVACKIARELGYDLLLTGHQHIPQAGCRVGHSWAVQTPANVGAYIQGVASLVENDQTTRLHPRTHALGEEVNGNAEQPCDVDESRNQWQFSSTLVEPGEKADASLCAALQSLEDATQQWLDRPVCAVRPAIPPEEKLEAALHGSRIAKVWNDMQMKVSGAELSCTSLTNDALGMPEALTMRDILTLCPFSNTLVVLSVTPEILRQALERCAEYYELIDGKPVVSERFLKPKVEHYNYDFYAGTSYSFDLRRPVGERVVRLENADGTSLENRSYTLCVSNYRATGTGGYEMLRNCPVVWRGGEEVTDLLIRYLKAKPTLQVPEAKNMEVLF